MVEGDTFNSLARFSTVTWPVASSSFKMYCERNSSVESSCSILSSCALNDQSVRPLACSPALPLSHSPLRPLAGLPAFDQRLRLRQQFQALRFDHQIAGNRRRRARAVSSSLNHDGPGDYRVFDRRKSDEPRIDAEILLDV